MDCSKWLESIQMEGFQTRLSVIDLCELYQILQNIHFGVIVGING
jgi:hypothetical protein